MQYEPTLESVRQHQVPDWFHNAKLGIFIHWGLYSVPAWAPLAGDLKLDEVMARGDWETWFTNNPYAEWYLNSLRLDGSPTQQHHVQTYGQSFGYSDFVPSFNQAIRNWDPGEWAGLFKKIGARYVVLTTKHHDGFLLWPSRQPNPYQVNYSAGRDLVGELSAAVRSAGMKMGLYYSGGLDWTFTQEAVKDIGTLFSTIPQSPAYVEYATNHWYELIDRYDPSILWNDIGYPAAANLPELFAHFYNKLGDDGVINNRFSQQVERADPFESDQHFDFKTPEYSSFAEITPDKWEATRGIGYSFGYNQNEGVESYLSVAELVHSFVDVVSKNGNLLLNIGPVADGAIPEMQRERVLGLGNWLDINGDAIFDTRPWLTAEGKTGSGLDVRFTQKDNAVYAVVLASPTPGQVSLQSLRLPDGAMVHLLGRPEPLSWQQQADALVITLPKLPSELSPEALPAYTLRLSPPPQKIR